MRRRDTLPAVAVFGVAPCVLAQPRNPTRPFRIGLLWKTSPQARDRAAAAYARHNWVERSDYVLIGLDADPSHRVDDDVRTILAKGVDLLVVTSTAAAIAAHRQTKTVPVVMAMSGYPVEAGVAESLARPGRNVTGNTAYASTGIWGKLIELLGEAKPGIKRVGVLWGYVPPTFPREEIEPIAKEFSEAEIRRGVRIHRVDVQRADQLADALKAIEGGKPDGLVLTSGPALWPTRQQILQFASQRRLPTVADVGQPPEDEGLRPLLVYQPDLAQLGDQATEYVVRILRDGANPSELPIRMPAKFELVVNLRAANAIGLALPATLLVRADRVIQ
jgi:putative ABC transport system substrate-binding protein